jgi:hypothetical protein
MSIEETALTVEETGLPLPEGRWLTFGDAIAKYNLSNSILSSKRDKVRRHGRYYNEDDIIAMVNDPSYLARSKSRAQSNGNNVWPEGFITKANAIRKYKLGSSYLYKLMKNGGIAVNEQGQLSEADVMKAANDPIYKARSAARRQKKTKRAELKASTPIIKSAPQESHESQGRKELEHYHTAYAAGWIASWIATYCAQSGDGLSARDVTRRVCHLLLGS